MQKPSLKGRFLFSLFRLEHRVPGIDLLSPAFLHEKKHNE